MKRIIQSVVVVTIAFVLWQVSADARFLDLKKKEQIPDPKVTSTSKPIQPKPSYKSDSNPSGISLQFEGLTLLDVVRNIQDETGILFSIDPSIETIPFNASIQAGNWEEAVKELLKGFSRVEVWTSNLKTSRVWVVSGGRNALEHVGKQNPDIVLKRKPAPRVLRQQKSRTVPVSPKTAISKVRIEDLPPHILFEPGVLTLFKSKGIQLPEKVKNMFGPNLEGLPANMPISPHVLNDPTFINVLTAQGINPPRA